jgi:hypothetical protein
VARANDVVQHLEALRINGLEVVDQERDRYSPRREQEQLGDVVLEIVVRCHTIVRGTDTASDRLPPAFDSGSHRRREDGAQRGQAPPEYNVRARRSRPFACRRGNREPALTGFGCQLPQETGLSHTRFPGQEQQLTPCRLDRVENGPHSVDLLIPPYQ